MPAFRENRGFFCTFMFAITMILVSVMIGFFYSASAADTMPIPELSFRYEGTDVIMDIKHLFEFALNEELIDRGPSVRGDIIYLEVDGIPETIKLCHFDCDDMNAITNCTEERSGLITTSYTLGEITGTPPQIRARIRRAQCMANDMTISYGHWSALKDAVVPEPIPVVEIASIIGVGGIAIAVINNYWSGRRENQMTEVTRTAAVDERFMELYDASRETEFQRTQAEVLYQYEWSDYDDFLAKYGPRANVDAWAKIQSIAQYYEGIGVMVQTQSVDLDQVSRLLSNQIIEIWEKLDDVILERRKREVNLTIYSAFESLYYAIKNYQQQGPPQQDDVRTHKFD